jgi:hypothetical protein
MVSPTISFGQAQQRQQSLVDSLKAELSYANRRAQSAQEEAERQTYLVASKELALRSMEVKDSILQALLAVQAYKFNSSHRGDPSDIDIYRALYRALTRLNEVVTLPPDPERGDTNLRSKTAGMANLLCTRINRNIKIAEWNMFCSHIKYERTCEVSSKK